MAGADDPLAPLLTDGVRAPMLSYSPTARVPAGLDDGCVPSSEVVEEAMSSRREVAASSLVSIR